jgi:hypothetical protein
MHEIKRFFEKEGIEKLTRLPDDVVDRLREHGYTVTDDSVHFKGGYGIPPHRVLAVFQGKTMPKREEERYRRAISSRMDGLIYKISPKNIKKLNLVSTNLESEKGSRSIFMIANMKKTAAEWVGKVLEDAGLKLTTFDPKKHDFERKQLEEKLKVNFSGKGPWQFPGMRVSPAVGKGIGGYIPPFSIHAIYFGIPIDKNASMGRIQAGIGEVTSDHGLDLLVQGIEKDGKITPAYVIGRRNPVSGN